MMAGVSSLPIGIFLVGIGLATAFFGYRLLKIILGIVGFALGAMGGHNLLVYFGVHGSTALLVGAILAGLIGAFLVFPLFMLGVFALGSATGILLVHVIGYGWSPIAIVVGIVAGGFLAVAFQRPLIIIATAVDGAALTVMGVASFFRPIHWHPQGVWPPPHASTLGIHTPIAWIAIAVLAAIALIHQFRDGRQANRTEKSR